MPGWDAGMRKSDLSVVDLSSLEESVEGAAFLVEERRPRESIILCEKYLAEGANLMIISRDPPQKLIEGMPIVPRKAIWITNLPGKDHLDPTAVGLLMGEIRKFVEVSGKRAVILIDGLEFLISVNTYDRMLQFVSQVRDIAVTSGSILIIPFDMRTLNEREQALLERNLQVIQTPPSHDGDQVIQISSDEGIGT
ncbi:MAG: DUF835 domain-containing protein [Thermoplasmata archaeon]